MGRGGHALVSDYAPRRNAVVITPDRGVTQLGPYRLDPSTDEE